MLLDEDLNLVQASSADVAELQYVVKTEELRHKAVDIVDFIPVEYRDDPSGEAAFLYGFQQDFWRREQAHILCVAVTEPIVIVILCFIYLILKMSINTKALRNKNQKLFSPYALLMSNLAVGTM